MSGTKTLDEVILNAFPQAAIACTCAGNVLWVNQAALDLFGLPAAGRQYATLRTLLGEANHRVCDDLLFGCGQTEADAGNLECTVLLANDRRLALRVTRTPLPRPEDGLAWLLTFEDATGQAEAVLQPPQAPHFGDAIVDQALVGIVVYDKSLRVLGWNPFMETFTGRSAAEVQGRVVHEVFPKLHPLGLVLRLQEALSGATVDSGDVPYTDPQGREKWYVGSCAPHRRATGEIIGAVAVITDITERKNTQRLLEAQRDLACALSEAADLHDALKQCLRTALQVDGLDAGGIYIVDPVSGVLSLEAHQGLHGDFVKSVSRMQPDHPWLEIVREAKPVYACLTEAPFTEVQALGLGLQSLVVLPIAHEGRVLAILNVGSSSLTEIPLSARHWLEAVASQMGSFLARLQTEEALRQSEARCRQLMESLTDLNWDADASMRFTRISAGISAVLGYSAEEVVGKQLYDMIPGTELERLTHWFSATLEKPVRFAGLELKMFRQDGKVACLEISAAPFFDDRGQLTGWHGTLRDITTRKQAEEAVQESEERLRLISDNMLDLVLQVDNDGFIRYVSPSCQRLLGYSPLELTGASLLTWAHPADAEGLQYAQPAAHAGDPAASPAAVEVRILHQDGHYRWFSCLINTLQNDRGGAAGAIIGARDISDRMRAESALRESRATAWAMLNATHDLAMLVDRDGRILGINEAFAQSLGRRITDLVGQRTPDLFSDEVTAYRQAQAQQVFVTAQPVRFEEERGGRLFNTAYYPVLDGAGQVGKLAIFARDITDARTAEQQRLAALRELQKLEEVVSRSPAVAFLWRSLPNWSVEFVSDNVRMWGYTPENLRTGRVCYLDIIHGDDLPRVLAQIKEFMRRGIDEYRQVYRLLTADGDVRWVDDHTRLRRDEAGQVVYCAGIVLDVTDRIEAEEALRQSEERLRSLLEQFPGAILVTDAELRITYVAGEGLAAAGLSPDELLGANIDVLENKVTDSSSVEQVAQRALQGQSALVTLGFHERMFNIQFEPWLDGAGDVAGVLLVALDVTDQRNAHEAQRLAAVGQLAAGVAHEFNNILCGLWVRSDLARARATAAGYETLIDTVIAAAQRGSRICSDLLSFARPAPPARTPISVEEALDTALELAMPQLVGADIEVVRDYQADLPTMMGDRSQLEQVFLNLLINAGHAMPQGGRLTVQILSDETAEQAKSIIVRVADTGIGITPEHLPRIFEPFFTTKSRLGEGGPHGSGLGLSVSHGIVTAHEGTISVQSEVDCGTTFTLRFPTDADLGPGADGAGQSAPTVRTTLVGRRLLVAEDQEDLLEDLVGALEEVGAEVEGAASATAAVAALKDRSFDLVLTDVLMPGGGAWAVARAAQNAEQPPALVVMTGKLESSLEDELRAGGVAGFVTKPFSLAQILELLAEVLAAGL